MRVSSCLTLLAAIAATASAVSGCSCDEATDTADTASASSVAASEAPSSTGSSSGQPGATPEQQAAWQACEERRQELLKQPELPGAAEYEKNRIHAARVRGRPLLWRQPPKASSSALADRLAKEKPLEAVKGILWKYRKNLPLKRKALLREGYLWHESIDVALALVEQVGLTQLFDNDSLTLARGAEVLPLRRAKRTRYLPIRYVYDDGPRKGQTAEILFGDRVGPEREEVLKDPLGIDLRDAERQYHFDRLRPVRLTAGALVADLRYGPETWVPGVLDLEGATAKLSCEVLTVELAEKKKAFLESDQLARSAMRRLRDVVREMVAEEIPFDAAREQKNGFMRRTWRRAYFKKWRRFTIAGRKYDVYSSGGRAIPPQVCIDFIIDTWERAAGKWYQPLEGDPPRPNPGVTPGPIDFEKMDLKNRRSVVEFVKLTKRHPDLFDVWDIPKEGRFAFKDTDRFFRYLAEHADDFQRGDMLIIHGYKKGGRPHYHSLIVLEKDPITGIPTLVAGNAVKPREQTIQGVMQISPGRSLRHRIRLRQPWLELVAAKAPAPEASE